MRNSNYLVKEINDLKRPREIDYAIKIQNSNSKIIFEYNSDLTFNAASLIKIVIVDYLLNNKINKSSFFNKVLPITSQDIVGGAGVLRGLSIDKLKVRDLIYLMLSISDNTATNVLLKQLQLQNLSEWSKNKFKNIRIERFMMNNSVENNIINLKEFMNVWTEILNSNDELGSIVRDALSHSLTRSKLPALISKSGFIGEIYTKTGELTHEEHDVSRFEYDDEFIDCAVLTHFNYESQRIDCIRFIQEIGLIISEIF
ncbi:serine hydrolase [Companilactobacillus halodurans]|uniref:Serine hydrolase n=1 Tax=Companilactobacillus halodurans TaxID=2584183 RepID=A0A5P0ZLU5_9LACO|nr:serine hydrolase [Companilactobacillus halodurans]MQS75152.1 serine hydrolase [Companilactobacillus halodurans]MQS97584.1 serine hydrolase [Companilactobacillus halodurans]